MHKTTAWPLALIYAALVVYASLYPFSDWRDQGLVPWSFLLAPLPRYWTWFDVSINVIGYVPFGGLLALGLLRGSRSRHPLLWATVLAGLLSLCMEGLQSYLPYRVASREDWLLNVGGAWLGAAITLTLERWGAIARWSQLRRNLFVEPARGGLVLLAIWPLALLFPAPVPFGLGQVLERVLAALADQGAPLADWLPLGMRSLQPQLPATEALCVALGLLIPCLLGFCVVRALLSRMALVLAVLLVGTAATSMSAALSWGPGHAWAWFDTPAQLGMASAAVLGLLLVFAPWRASAALMLLGLGLYLSLLNQAPESPYFAQTLQQWEQGRFIRFNGLSQWLGWLWPYAAMLYVLSRLGRRDYKN